MAAIDVIATTIFVLTGIATFDTFGIVGTLSGYWVGLTYLVSCIAMVVYLRRNGELKPWLLVVGAVGTAAFVYFYWVTAVPMPPSPWNIVLYIFFASVILSLIHWAVLAVNRSPTLARFGTSASSQE